MTEHLGHEKHGPVANAAGNTHNGRIRKALKGKFGELLIEAPATAMAPSTRSWSEHRDTSG